jgi:hypothetical protein
VAREYTFYGAADTTSDDLRSVIAAAVGGSMAADGTIFLEGMYITARSVSPADRHSTTLLFGFDHRITVIFRFSNLARGSTAEHNTSLMAIAILALFDAYGEPGVLLYNGEEVILQKLDGGVVFNEDWEEWFEIDDLAPVLAAHARQRLPQPLL